MNKLRSVYGSAVSRQNEQRWFSSGGLLTEKVTILKPVSDAKMQQVISAATTGMIQSKGDSGDQYKADKSKGTGDKIKSAGNKSKSASDKHTIERGKSGNHGPKGSHGSFGRERFQKLNNDKRQKGEKSEMGWIDILRLQRGMGTKSKTDQPRVSDQYNKPNIKVVEVESLPLKYESVEPLDKQPPVARIQHDIDRVLFSPGVHFIRDPRTGVYNFPPYVEKLMSIKDFNFDFVPRYVPSGEDSTLSQLAYVRGLRYTASTSSLTSILSQLHFLISHLRLPQILSMSKYFPGTQALFSYTQRKPQSTFLRYNAKTNTHALDDDKSNSDDILVSILGHLLEAMLTTPEEKFKTFTKGNKNTEEVSNSYHYGTDGNFLLRSQLDCYDPRLPGTGVYDLKTRAACAVRHDMDYAQINDGTDYVINKLDGVFESFSREWYDLVRTGLLKYSLQARIGRMDGILVAYHNVRTMFGFQYLPLVEMDKVYHTSNLISNDAIQQPDFDDQMATTASATADTEFKLSLKLLHSLIDTVVGDETKDGAGTSFNIVFHCDSLKKMLMFVKPMSESDIAQIQESRTESELNPETLKGLKGTKYVNGANPHTIIQLARDGTGFLPPDMQIYEVEIDNYIDGKYVTALECPNVQSDKQNWTIRSKVERLSGKRKAIAYSQLGKKCISDEEYTSSPQTERLPPDQELQLQTEMLGRLGEPTALQSILRKLGEKGRKYHEQQPKRPVVWTPSSPQDSV